MSQTQGIIEVLIKERELARNLNLPLMALGISRAIEVVQDVTKEKPTDCSQ